MRKQKFRFEAATDQEAAFIFCEYNPVIKAAVREFRTLKEMDEYVTANKVIQVRRHLPILLEVFEVDSQDPELIRINLERMAEWYYYRVVMN